MSFLDDLTDDEQTDTLKATVRRLEKKLAATQRSQDAIIEAVYQAIHDGIAAVDIPDVYLPPTDPRKVLPEVAVLHISDIQLGKRTKTYNSEVASERIQKLVTKTRRITERQRAHVPVRDVHVFLLGDEIEGELIFPGQAHLIDSSLYRQVTVEGPEIIVTALLSLAETFETVYVWGVPGNHGFVGGRSRREMHPDSNADRMLYRICSLMTQHVPNIEWTIAEDWYTVADVGEKCRFLLFHGHQIKGWSNFPWYGVAKKLLGWRSLSEGGLMEPFDHAAFGHFHTPTSGYLNDIRWWCNGSTESHNAYAQELLASMGRPAQWLLFAKPGFGITGEYLLQLD